MTDWLTALNSLASAIVGGSITLFVGERSFRRDRAEKRHVATMQISVQLRTWLIDTMRVFRDHEVFEQPDPNDDGSPYGYYFPTPSDIPVFPFADSLERVSQIKSALAQAIFELFESRAKAERSACIIAELIDHEEAAKDFEQGIGNVWLKALEIYKLLAKEVAWEADAVTDSELADMKKLVEPPLAKNGPDVMPPELPA